MICAPFTDAVSIALSPDALVAGNSIELGEVAVVSGADAETLARLAAVDLGYSPSPGYTRLIFVERVREAVELAWPGLVFDLTGAPTCKVAPITSTVTGERMNGVAREALETAVRDGRVTVELQQGALDALVPEGEAPPVVRAALNSPDVRSGVQSVTVRVEVDGHVYATRQVLFRVERWQEVAVLRRAVPAGAVITPDLVELREVVQPAQQREPALTASMLVGAVAARSLEAGRALAAVDVHRPNAVEAQASIIVEVRRGAVSARAVAVALQGGPIGERIRIRVADSGREMFAVIESRDLVVVDLTPGVPGDRR